MSEVVAEIDLLRVMVGTGKREDAQEQAGGGVRQQACKVRFGGLWHERKFEGLAVKAAAIRKV